MLKFEWSVRKAQLNEAKHAVSFMEAKSVFFDDEALQFYDEVHSVSEERFIMLGMSEQLRLLVVVHCVRDEGRVLRIISARKASRSERQYYPGEAH